MELLTKVLRENTMPAQEQKAVLSAAKEYIKELGKSISRLGYTAEPVLGGSAAKGTMVREDFDIDIFVRFDPKYKDEDLPYMLEELLKDANRVHGSRDYFMAEYKGMSIEIVPVLKISHPREARNVTDMSPLHVFWIEKMIGKNPGLKDEIIIAKVFCKAQGIYGAESYISGFSGHVLDILIAYYGSFIKLIENAVQWPKYKVIDISGHGNEINSSKISPLIVIDPVDPNRNAAAALSEEKFMKFRNAAGAFMKKPRMEFFIQKKPDRELLRKMAGKNSLLIVSTEPQQDKYDVAGAKLLKVYEHIKRHILINDFSLVDSGWYWDKKGPAMMWFITPGSLLSPKRIHIGPPLRAKEAAKRFAQKHPASFVQEDRLVVEMERRYRECREMLKDLLEGEYVTSRCRGAVLE